MSFFELDGGAKKRAPAKKASGKKASGKKKGGNFLGTVSELFAPAGWENFVTAAGLLALDRTDNYLRKNKDSKKQHGGTDGEEQHQEEHHQEEMESFTSRMRGGSRKRSSSRKQRGGSDGHHSTADLIEMMKTSQNGGKKKKTNPKKKVAKKVKGRKHKGGAFTPDQEKAIYNAYLQTDNPNKYKITNNSTYNPFIKGLLETLGYPSLDNDVNEAKLIIDTKIIEEDIQTFSGNNNNTVRGVPPNTRRSTNIRSAKQKLEAAQQR